MIDLAWLKEVSVRKSLLGCAILGLTFDVWLCRTQAKLNLACRPGLLNLELHHPLCSKPRGEACCCRKMVCSLAALL